MKPVKKILALILAGVMALALLTGCGKATSLNRTMAEGFAEYEKWRLAYEDKNTNSISFSSCPSIKTLRFKWERLAVTSS